MNIDPENSQTFTPDGRDLESALLALLRQVGDINRLPERLQRMVVTELVSRFDEYPRNAQRGRPKKDRTDLFTRVEIAMFDRKNLTAAVRHVVLEEWREQNAREPAAADEEVVAARIDTVLKAIRRDGSLFPSPSPNDEQR
ncbi:hypothetical protein [Paraburkholderia atlantica]|uniref:hypothetical protein n=1 Tax=Paraburkholderia atlantica TaxID=2654982 RepID=UPI003D1A6D51